MFGRLSSSLLAFPRLHPAERGSDFEVAGFDILLDLIESRTFGYGFPGRKSAVENVVHFLQGFAFRFGCCQEHVDECCSVECCEDHVHLPVA